MIAVARATLSEQPHNFRAVPALFCTEMKRKLRAANARQPPGKA
jgi:hypothetical protein